jgi:transcriptional regulator with XRE-family HTH domain
MLHDQHTGDPELGARLRALREGMGLSVRQAADLSAGEIKPSTLSAYERGDRALSVSKLAFLASMYDVPVTVFLTEQPIIDLTSQPSTALA